MPRRAQQALARMCQQAQGAIDAARAAGTFAFHDWIRTSIGADKPYDAFVRELLSADGADEKTRPAAKFFLDRDFEPHVVTKDIGRVFLGRNIQCAQCHHHPYEKWSQDDYWGLAAFFGRVGRKNAQIPGGVANAAAARQVIFNKPAAEYTGNTLLCEDVLVDSGVTDLSVYDCVPGGQLGVDFWVDGVNPPGYSGP